MNTKYSSRTAIAFLLAHAPLAARQDYDWSWSNDIFKPVGEHEKDISVFVKPAAFDMKQVFGSQRLPNIVVTTKGIVIAATGWNTVLVRRSEDAGETWGEETEVRDGKLPGWIGK